jgi:hypothetical protein
LLLHHIGGLMRKAIIILALLAIGCVLRAEDEAQYRPAMWVTLWDVGRFDVAGYGELRYSSEDLAPFGYLIGPRFSYLAQDWLALRAGYTFIEADTSTPVGLRKVFSHRAEFEVNPIFQLNDTLRFRLRNRYEYRWLEGGTTDNRTRHRPELTWALSGLGPLDAFQFWNETFFDWDSSQVTLNRFSPAGVRLRITDYSALRLFYFWEHRFRQFGVLPPDAHVFYTLLELKLN